MLSAFESPHLAPHFPPCKACRNIIQLEKCTSQAHIDFSVGQIVSVLPKQVFVSITFDFYYHLALLCELCGLWLMGTWKRLQ